MKIIKLTQGQVTFVDDDVYEWASKFKWQAKRRKSGGFNATRASSTKIDGKQHTILLHREIMHAKDGLEVDHKYGDSLNNQRENLRIVTKQQNHRAYKKPKVNATSKFRGVSWHKAALKWVALITIVTGKPHYLGLFKEERAAAKAYDTAAQKYFGQYAQLNFPLTKTL